MTGAQSQRPIGSYPDRFRARADSRLRQAPRADARSRARHRAGTAAACCCSPAWTDYAFSSDNVAASQAGLAHHRAGARGQGCAGAVADGDRADRPARRTAADDPGGPVGRAPPGRARRAASSPACGSTGIASRQAALAPAGGMSTATLDPTTRWPEVARIFRRAPPGGHRAADLRLRARHAELALEDR